MVISVEKRQIDYPHMFGLAGTTSFRIALFLFLFFLVTILLSRYTNKTMFEMNVLSHFTAKNKFQSVLVSTRMFREGRTTKLFCLVVAKEII